MASGRDRRLDRLLPGLSAQERAILMLRQYKAGTEGPPVVLGGIPSNQIPALNRYLRLMNTVNCDLGAALLLLNAQMRQIDIKYAWMTSLLMLGDEFEGVACELLRETKEPKLKRQIKRLLAQREGSIAARLVRALVCGIKDGLGGRWRELRAIELVLEDVAEEFGGEDPLRADTRALLDDARAVCERLCSAMQLFVEEFALPEPTDDDVEMVERFVKSRADGG